MMDNEMIFSEALSCAIGTGSVYGSYAYDMGTAEPDIGAGKPLWLIINVTTAFTSSGSATVTFILVDEEDTDIEAGSVEIATTGAIDYDVLTEGKIVALAVPIGRMTQRYLGLKVTVGGTTTNAGVIDAHLALDVPSNVPIT